MSTPIVGRFRGLRSGEDGCVEAVVFEDAEDDVEHLVGDVAEGDEVMLATVDVFLVDLGKEWVLALEDGESRTPA